MCNIAFVTFLWLQYWSAWLIKTCEHRKTCIFCVLSLVKPTKNVLKFALKNVVLKFHFLLLGALWMYIWWVCTWAAHKKTPNPLTWSLLTQWEEMSYVCTYSSVQLDKSRVEKEIYLQGHRYVRGHSGQLLAPQASTTRTRKASMAVTYGVAAQFHSQS